MIAAALVDARTEPSRDDSRLSSIFGVNADPKLAAKLFRENFADYMRLKNVADLQQRNRRA